MVGKGKEREGQGREGEKRREFEQKTLPLCCQFSGSTRIPNIVIPFIRPLPPQLTRADRAVCGIRVESGGTAHRRDTLATRSDERGTGDEWTYVFIEIRF
ncbi:hypothetical protein E2C01_084961 [Portunus trituberculatus]|uniref:Uncharacterized protein n=1 Tax=Portunus trituberculatus TaxID=210409 RepID=A0A5B7J5D8_PORTR|nr:hypothetical protein [Portunus trituberculatus]